MYNFNFYMPTKVLFGPGRLNDLHSETLPGKKALIAIGGQSVKKFGYLDRLEQQLDMAGVQHVLFEGIRPNPARLKTAYKFYDGKSSGEETGGFVPAEDATQINWIICPKSAPIAVSKTDNMKIIDPNTNQSADAWLLAYRKFHDLWIKDNMLPCIRVCAVAASKSTQTDPSQNEDGT